MIPDLNCKLPYEKDNLYYLDINNKFNISGKNLNKIPKQLLENDKYILDKLIFFYETIDELEGDNLNGLIDHINQLKTKIIEIKKADEELEKSKFNFLKENDCKISIEDIFPCKELEEIDIYAYFENTHLQYYDGYINKKPRCEDYISCEDNKF
jgi:hypothetical protein